MAFTSRHADISYDLRCLVCRAGLDRAGRYCARCLRSRRLKLFFGTLAFAQCAAVAIFVSQSRGVDRVVPSDGLHTVAVATAGPTGWYYFDVTDPLIQDVSHHARIIADLPLPSGDASASTRATGGTLDVSFSRHYGKSVVLTFPPVQRACLANVCELRVVFDRVAPQTVPYQDVSDRRATVLMLSEPSAFLKRLPTAHGLTFIASLGTATDTTVSFNVEGFHLQMAANGQSRRLALKNDLGPGGDGTSHPALPAAPSRQAGPPDPA